MKVHIVCRNYEEDRVVPRMARLLRDRLGWSIGLALDSKADVNYLLGYFEASKCCGWQQLQTAAYLTHREEEPGSVSKAMLFDEVARQTQLRVVTCRMYYDLTAQWGPTLRAHAPVERERFRIPGPTRRGKLVIGFSGYTYGNGRKGENLAYAVVNSKLASSCEFTASGRGWPMYTKKYAWADMPGFYQRLDILVCTSLVEGIPMPPLEALSCGVSVVIPRGVGLLDELPEMIGITRYSRGNADELVKALEQAVAERGKVDRGALREAVAQHSDAAWVEDHKEMFERMTAKETVRKADGRVRSLDAGLRRNDESSKRGIYVVAFGEPARETASKLLASIQQYMPDIPVCLVGSEPLHAGESVFKPYADRDIGARRAKLAIDDLAPADWKEVLYLDADTVLVAPVYQLFDWIRDGWEFVICRDVYPRDNLSAMRARYEPAEVKATYALTHTWEVTQLNGGVWSYARNERTARFFKIWQSEYERWCQRDQGALLRALFMQPLKMLTLGNEWNTFPRYQNEQISAGILHYPQEARRWAGQIMGRIDSAEAWQAVKRFENSRIDNGRRQ